MDDKLCYDLFNTLVEELVGACVLQVEELAIARVLQVEELATARALKVEELITARALRVGTSLPPLGMAPGTTHIHSTRPIGVRGSVENQYFGVMRIMYKWKFGRLSWLRYASAASWY
ncbi:unnamed protein product [Sphagnum tenellum]